MEPMTWEEFIEEVDEVLSELDDRCLGGVHAEIRQYCECCPEHGYECQTCRMMRMQSDALEDEVTAPVPCRCCQRPVQPPKAYCDQCSRSLTAYIHFSPRHKES